MQNTFGLEIYAANRQFFAGRARSLIIPAEDGQKEFLAHHANMICAIVPGEMRFEDSEGNWLTVAVSSGFVEMINNRAKLFCLTVERPEEIDRTSSPSTVYLRKNIEQVEKEVEGADGKMQTVTEWQYDEKEMTVEEYENMALMKSVVEENTSGIVESVTQFQKDAVIDEYTAQLIEEGLI